MSITEVHGWHVALHHRTNRGDNARHTELVGAWLRKNADCVVRCISDDWIAIGIAPSSEEARALLDRFQAEMAR